MNKLLIVIGVVGGFYFGLITTSDAIVKDCIDNHNFSIKRQSFECREKPINANINQ